MAERPRRAARAPPRERNGTQIIIGSRRGVNERFRAGRLQPVIARAAEPQPMAKKAIGFRRSGVGRRAADGGPGGTRIQHPLPARKRTRGEDRVRGVRLTLTGKVLTSLPKSSHAAKKSNVRSTESTEKTRSYGRIRIGDRPSARSSLRSSASPAIDGVFGLNLGGAGLFRRSRPLSSEHEVREAGRAKSLFLKEAATKVEILHSSGVCFEAGLFRVSILSTLSARLGSLVAACAKASGGSRSPSAWNLLASGASCAENGGGPA